MMRELTLNVEDILGKVGRVEDNGIDTGELLHHLDTICGVETAEGLLFAAGKVVLELDLSTTGGIGLGGERVGDALELVLDIGGVDRLVVEIGKDLKGLLVAILGHEETGRLRETDEHDYGDETENGLEDNGGTELG